MTTKISWKLLTSTEALDSNQDLRKTNSVTIGKMVLQEF